MVAIAPKASVEHLVENPWPGLAPFDERRSRQFSGRDRERERLCRLLDDARSCVLYGESGLGKTSLLRAGLVPTLEAGTYVPVYVRLAHEAAGPTLLQQLRREIRRALGERRISPPPFGSGESLWEYFHRRDLVLELDGKPRQLLLILDQFEETFTLGQEHPLSKRRAAIFVRELAALVEEAPRRLTASAVARIERRLEDDELETERAGVKLLVAIREDHLADLDGLQRLFPSLAKNRMRLLALDGTQALESVTCAGSSWVDQKTATAIVRAVSGADRRQALEELRVEPALLSLVCRGLVVEAHAKGRRRISTESLAGTQDVLRKFYQDAIGALEQKKRAFIEEELVTASGYRDSAHIHNAEARLGKATLRTLVAGHILRAEARNGRPRVELVHDVLVPIVLEERQRRGTREVEESLDAVIAVVEQLSTQVVEELRGTSRESIRTFEMILDRGLDVFNRLPSEQREKASVCRVEAELLRMRAEAHQAKGELSDAKLAGRRSVRLLRRAARAPQASVGLKAAYLRSVLFEGDLCRVEGDSRLRAAYAHVQRRGRTTTRRRSLRQLEESVRECFRGAAAPYNEVLRRTEPDLASAPDHVASRLKSKALEKTARLHRSLAETEAIFLPAGWRAAARRELDSALRHYEQAYQERTYLSAEHGRVERQTLEGDRFTWLGNYYLDMLTHGIFRKRSAAWHEAARAALDNHEQAREKRAAVLHARPDDLEAKRALAFSINNVGRVHIELGDHAAAIECYVERVAQAREVNQQDPYNIRYRLELAEGLWKLGGAHLDNGSTKTGVSFLEQAADKSERSVPLYLETLERAYRKLGNRAGARHLRAARAALRNDGLAEAARG